MRPAIGHERLVFDPLEPRLLLNADVLSVNLAHDLSAPPADHSLIVQLVQQTEQVNNQTVAVQRVQVVDQTNNNAVLAFGDLNEISGISIAAGAGNTSLTIDAKSFAGQNAPSISFTGGNGQNNVIFDNSTATDWTLTGANAGKVSGNGVDLSFQNVANLIGGSNNSDTLTVDQGGTLSGVFDGGTGAGNSMLINSWDHGVAEISVGPQYNTLTLDGQAYNYSEVQNTNIGDPFDVVAHGGVGTITMTANVGGFSFSGNFGTLSAAPNAGSEFEVIVGQGNSLVVDGTSTANGGTGNGAIDFSNFNTNGNQTPFVIDGNGNSVEIKGSVIDNAGISIATGAQTGNAHGSITVDQGASITGSTISLEADASSTTATTDSSSANLSINSGNANLSATIDIEGSISASSTLTVTTDVVVNDSIDADNDAGLQTVTVNANDTSTVTFGSQSIVSAASIDAEAHTTVTATIEATGVSSSIWASYLPGGISAVEVTTNITNTTKVVVVSDASHTASLTATSGDIDLAAVDVTNASVNIALTDPTTLPVVGGVLLFSALDSQDNLNWLTAVDVGNFNAVGRASSAAQDILHAAAGDIALAAMSSGTVTNSETSKAVGTVEINTSGNGDTTEVIVDGVKVDGLGLALMATSATNYAVSGHATTITIDGATDAEVENDYLGLTGSGVSDGLIVSAEDDFEPQLHRRLARLRFDGERDDDLADLYVGVEHVQQEHRRDRHQFARLIGRRGARAGGRQCHAGFRGGDVGRRGDHGQDRGVRRRHAGGQRRARLGVGFDREFVRRYHRRQQHQRHPGSGR